MNRIFSFLFVIFLGIPAQAQLIVFDEDTYPKTQNSHIQGEILLQLTEPGSIQKVMDDINKYYNDPVVEIVAELSDVANIWHIKYNTQFISDENITYLLKHSPYVGIVQFNHDVALRATEPNDPQYTQQWQYDNDGSSGGVPNADIDAPEAWDITTGGLTALGDTIVVAIIDDGTNLNHPDLAGNLWKNYSEIPGNNIDDDNNGYVDDVEGWNAANNNGSITGGSHGTCVSGIVGATGNNNLGVSGVNWNIKLMIIRGSSGTEATVVSAYNYALKMRKLYNQTNGVQGAFVVATNSSFGVDNGNPNDYPLWCAMYDSMGVAGILSAGATANANSNVDVVGDLPTACSSDYLITVTNVGRNDEKVTSAGYGATTIDLGSFGQDTWTLTQTGYGAFGGTSGATPHVTGTIALMYSVPCPEFIQFAKTNPAAAALQIKEWIMQSADPNASLAGLTVSGKRLNTFNAVSEVLNNCGPCPLPGALNALNITLNGANISWNANASATQYLIQYREVGQNIWQQQLANSSPSFLTGLTSCTNYEYRLRSICNSDSSTSYTLIKTFKTDGCCEPPISTTISGLTNNQAQVSWPSVTASSSYNFRYRAVGSSTWMDNNMINTTYTVTNLLPCTNYEYQIATVCTTGTTNYGVLYTFKTKGCSACEEATYCTSTASSNYLYINSISIGNIDNTSGDNTGYGNFVGGDYAWLMADSVSNISLSPFYPIFAVNTNWNIWIDWNQNGIFEASELALADNGTGNITGNITPPATSDTGITRMRIAASGFQAPVECGDAGFGEVEDYCVRIKAKANNGMNANLTDNSVVVFPNPANTFFNIKFSKEKYNKIEWMDISGKILKTITTNGMAEQIQISTEMTPSGVYFIQLSGEQGALTKKIIITR